MFRMKKQFNLKSITSGAVAAAITALLTLAIRIPTPTGGHINLGDTAVLFFAFTLGKTIGGISGALGSALADLIGGHYFFVPATFIIKGLEGFVAGLIKEKTSGQKGSLILASLIGISIMTAGYYIYEAVFINKAAALMVIIPNLIQGVSCALLAAIIYKSTRRR